jgi:hypothetical protein
MMCGANFVFKASPRQHQVVAALPSGGHRGRLGWSPYGVRLGNAKSSWRCRVVGVRGASAGVRMVSALAAMASIRWERRPSDAKARNLDAVRELCRI